MTITAERAATARLSISVDCLLYTRVIECGTQSFLFVYRSVWTDRSPNHPRMVEIREFIEDTGAVLVAESEQPDQCMMHREARLSVYRFARGV